MHRSATYDFLLTRSTATIGLSPTKSKKATHWPKIAIITTQPLFHATAEEFPLELGDGTWTQNMNDGVTCPGRKFDDIFSRLDTIYNIPYTRVTDRQTDRQTPTDVPCLHIALRGNKIKMTLTVILFTLLQPKGQIAQNKACVNAKL